MFSNLSSSSISLATVTPSLVMRGAPNDLSSTTLRPLGPSVTFTALLRISTPRSILSRASTENFTSLAAISVHSVWFCSGGLLLGRALFDDAHDVGLLHDEEVLAVDLDLGARPFAEQHAVADLDVDGDQLAGLVAAARTHRDDLALGGLFLGGVGNDDAAGGLLLGVDALDDDAVVKRTKLHDVLLSFWRDLVLVDGNRRSPIAPGRDISGGFFSRKMLPQNIYHSTITSAKKIWQSGYSSARARHGLLARAPQACQHCRNNAANALILGTLFNFWACHQEAAASTLAIR